MSVKTPSKQVNTVTALTRPTYCYTHNANKNITELIAANGSILAHYEYSPFGAVTATLGNNPNINPFQFSSEYFDAELGLTYYNYRHYNPNDGRWLSRDPIEEQGGMNLYRMGRNNLIRHIDIRGLFLRDAWEATVEAVSKVYEYKKKAVVAVTALVKAPDLANIPYAGFYLDMTQKLTAASIHLVAVEPINAYDEASAALDGLVSDMTGLLISNTKGKICAIETAWEQTESVSERIEAVFKIALIPNYKDYLGPWYGINGSERLTGEQIMQLSPNDFASYYHDIAMLRKSGGWKHIQWAYDVNTHALNAGEKDGPCGQLIRITGTVSFTLLAAPFDEIMYKLFPEETMK